VAQPRPIGMRIPRPYDTEEDFIRGDGLAIGRLGMILIGAPKRPPGITIRFEVLLRNDQPVFRGEGRVVAHRVHGNGREGLEIRFTRLDSRSKALVEQVLKLRRSGALTPLSTPLPDDEAEQPPAKAVVSKPPPPPPTSTKAKPPTEPPPELSTEPPPELSTEPPTELSTEPPTEPSTEPPTELSTEPPTEPPTERPTEPPTEPPTEEVLDSSELAPVESQRIEDEADEVTLDSVEVEEVVPEAEPSPPPVQAAVIKDEAVEASVEPAEQLVEELEEEPLDEDPTPFAPPVMLDAFEEEEAPTEQTEALPPAPRVEVSQDASAALSKLRQRAGAYERPESASSLLDRLRERSKSD